MDELTRHIQDIFLGICYLQKKNVLVDETKAYVNLKSELWTALESKHSMLDITKK